MSYYHRVNAILICNQCETNLKKLKGEGYNRLYCVQQACYICNENTEHNVYIPPISMEYKHILIRYETQQVIDLHEILDKNNKCS